LTDATIGAYTIATVLAFLCQIGVSEPNCTKGWWLALIVGLIVTGPTALTGFLDWLTIAWGTPLWRTATFHLASMLTATVFFLIAAIAGHDDYVASSVSAGSFVLTAIGFVFLTIGGWLGGAVVFVHGMRVLSLVDEPTQRAVSPTPHPEQEKAEGT